MARKVVGVGSVGTRAWVILMMGRDQDDPLFLQAKEAQASVLEPYVGASRYANAGQRVVEGQRFMQAASDIFLGWQRTAGVDGVERDFYVRQLRDWKGSWAPESMVPAGDDALRTDVLPDPRAGACALGRPDRDRVLPGQERRLRPGDRGVRRASTRTRTRRTTPRSRRRCDPGRSRRPRACSLRPGDRSQPRFIRTGGCGSRTGTPTVSVIAGSDGRRLKGARGCLAIEGGSDGSNRDGRVRAGRLSGR